MINVTYIVPYPELEDLVYKIFNAHPQKDIVNRQISVISADKLEGVRFNCDVLVARGYTAKKLKRLKPHIPQIEIPITGYDIIKTIEKCRKQFTPRKIGFVGTQSTIEGVNQLCGLFDCEIEIYNPEKLNNIEKTIENAVQNGCDVLVGGYYVNMCAKRMDVHSILIETGEEAITQALNEAIRTVEVMRQERAKADIFQTIAQCSQDGIIYVTCNGRIEVINKSAISMYQEKGTDFYHKDLKDVFPIMENSFKDIMKSGKEKNNVLHKTNNKVLSASYIPVMSDGKIAGIVINFQDSTKIQQVEIQIRKKMSAKGLFAKYHFDNIIHKSELMAQTIETAKKFSRVSSNILIVGETGTGKELMAQSIHNASSRSSGPFVAVNCAALPEALLESELFGYVDGAFTGASKGGKIGLFELAHSGTLFLDEVSEIPISFQSKLLRVLQEKEIRRVGGDKVVPIDVRIIAAANKNLKNLVQKDEFRQDLLYRLDILKLYIPPLRMRKEDISELFLHYLEKYNRKFNNHLQTLSSDALEMLMNYDFKGNVRELKNVVERLCVLNTSAIIDKASMRMTLYPQDIGEEIEIAETENIIQAFQVKGEKDLIEKALHEANYNKSKAAKALGIDRSTLWRKLKKYEIKI
ncbi:sigma-54-dependent Fis family transcriptional regulator [Metabacillus arenae]|uniref:Sigma 54-interacting transcriptional regulator n=1 Tax=Metabacillus arenae TaxID=2771434 RepID=A0A926NJ23_9BACI|nr:sigma-54-dependent Fis family transcriptional regulator [Metabacillus arenae]MBD1381985.1 sigma 54-interacting transcriptional regulator [Metabacillus arenae]